MSDSQQHHQRKRSRHNFKHKPSTVKPEEPLIGVLTASGHAVDTVPSEGLTGRPDEEIWRAAQSEGRFLITQDLHFANVHRFAPGAHAGILLVRLRLPGRGALFARVRSIFQTETVSEWSGCFVVATDHKIRVRRAKESHG